MRLTDLGVNVWEVERRCAVVEDDSRLIERANLAGMRKENFVTPLNSFFTLSFLLLRRPHLGLFSAP